MVRKIKPIRWLVLYLLAISAFRAHTQQLSDLSAVQRGDNVEVTYQLQGLQDKAYSVVLFASHNNYAAPLKLVEGDVGSKRILPGTGKLIVWKIKDELTNYFGDIAFEIRAVPAPPLFTEVATSAPKVKRESKLTVSWRGIDPQQRVSVDLLKGDKVIHAGGSSDGHLDYVIPRDMKPGKYNLRLSQGRETMDAGSVTVAPKIPLAAKIAAVPVVGVIVYLILREPPTEFPEPPDLTVN